VAEGLTGLAECGIRGRIANMTSGTGGNDMAENKHKQGEMDITEQEKTFAGFIRMSTNVAIVAIAIVVFLAIFAR
jgi:hypothetical protein